jgi:tetratricopeptide (TPR) repeat protein
VQFNDTYCPGDTLRVQERSRADVALLNQSVLRLNANTTITLEAVKEERTGVVALLKGAAHFFSRGPRSLDVRTPFTVAGVRGTEFLISVEAAHASLSVFEGTVVAANEAGSLTLTSGQSAVAEAGKAPVLRVVARPRDAVQWALYYPPVLYIRPDEFPAGPDWQGMVRQSLEFYLRGDLQRAFDSIANVPENVRDPRFFAYRASLLLAVGRVDEAGADIERALRLHPNDSNALALQTIIAVVQNDRDTALQVAQQAVGMAPDSATAQIALSYAQQARFDLKGARASLEKAVTLDPQNALAWARLAEIQSSFGDLKKALKAAQKAVALDPDLARTQTVLGFAYLTQIKTQQAKDTFAKAIALDQAAPLPRLGLGLAKIREGHLDEGGRDLEVAASLDPNNSLIRSYLGKAYYEEKRTGLDEREYAVAKELDPQDPTPWFYDAIAKQTTNRPVEALHNLQKSIELNDNRAVYRSRLLLDADLAARSASLARLYNELGFQQLALVEGWKSLNIDPGNYSAHWFLADTYAALPRHGIARSSELLQSQLLQPINITPVPPQLAESDLIIPEGLGPAAPSLNEFNPLFVRNRFALLASGIAGENDTLGDEVVQSGVWGRLSYSLGQYHYETDGFRKNNDLTQNLYNAFLQVSLSYNTSVQAEFRYTDTEERDRGLRFFPDDFLPNLRQDRKTKTGRLGLHHAFAPGSDIIASLIYKDVDAAFRDQNPDPRRRRAATLDEESLLAEGQYLFRSEGLDVISGAGYFTTTDRNQVIMLGRTGLLVDANDIHYTNLYMYSHLNYLQNVTVTLGVSSDFFKGTSVDRDQVNPKVGLTWTPFPSTTLRAAAFRVLNTGQTSAQTIEPTQVAGFNQFFGATFEQDFTSAFFPGIDAWRYGVGIDQKFSLSLYAGGEFSKQDLKVPGVIVGPGTRTLVAEDWDEYLARAYLYWTPHPWLAASVEYQFERFERGRVFGAGTGIGEVNTHRLPLGINFSHPSGLSVQLKATYLHQDGKFAAPVFDPQNPFKAGHDQFWLVDTAIRYRLPERRGFITLGVKNLFDEQFKFQELDPATPTVQRDRLIFGRITLAF